MADNIDNIIYTIRIKNQDNNDYTSYTIGTSDEYININDDSLFIQPEKTTLNTILPLKFNQGTINNISNLNTIDRQGFYYINKTGNLGQPEGVESPFNLLVLTNGDSFRQILFTEEKIYIRKNTSSDWFSFARLEKDDSFTNIPTFNNGFTSKGTIAIKNSNDDTLASIENTGKGTFNNISINNIASIDNAGKGTFNNMNINNKASIDNAGKGIFNNISINNIASIDNTGKGTFNNININNKASIDNKGILKIENDNNININFSNGIISGVTGGAVQISGGMLIDKSIYSREKVYNAVWNDLADSIIVNKDAEIEAGYCYCLKDNKYIKSSKYLDNGIIGIHSDTYGFKMGDKIGEKQLDCAVAGFVLAYVDKDYLPGTALTCTKDGRLTKMKLKDKQRFPEKIVATYWKDEPNEEWGSDNRKVKVNGRKWVKIK